MKRTEGFGQRVGPKQAKTSSIEQLLQQHPCLRDADACKRYQRRILATFRRLYWRRQLALACVPDPVSTSVPQLWDWIYYALFRAAGIFSKGLVAAIENFLEANGERLKASLKEEGFFSNEKYDAIMASCWLLVWVSSRSTDPLFTKQSFLIIQMMNALTSPESPVRSRALLRTLLRSSICAASPVSLLKQPPSLTPLDAMSAVIKARPTGGEDPVAKAFSSLCLKAAASAAMACPDTSSAEYLLLLQETTRCLLTVHNLGYPLEAPLSADIHATHLKALLRLLGCAAVVYFAESKDDTNPAPSSKHSLLRYYLLCRSAVTNLASVAHIIFFNITKVVSCIIVRSNFAARIVPSVMPLYMHAINTLNLIFSAVCVTYEGQLNIDLLYELKRNLDKVPTLSSEIETLLFQIDRGPGNSRLVTGSSCGKKKHKGFFMIAPALLLPSGYSGFSLSDILAEKVDIKSDCHSTSSSSHYDYFFSLTEENAFSFKALARPHLLDRVCQLMSGAPTIPTVFQLTPTLLVLNLFMKRGSSSLRDLCTCSWSKHLLGEGHFFTDFWQAFLLPTLPALDAYYHLIASALDSQAPSRKQVEIISSDRTSLLAPMFLSSFTMLANMILSGISYLDTDVLLTDKSFVLPLSELHRFISIANRYLYSSINHSFVQYEFRYSDIFKVDLFGTRAPLLSCIKSLLEVVCTHSLFSQSNQLIPSTFIPATTSFSRSRQRFTDAMQLAAAGSSFWWVDNQVKDKDYLELLLPEAVRSRALEVPGQSPYITVLAAIPPRVIRFLLEMPHAVPFQYRLGYFRLFFNHDRALCQEALSSILMSQTDHLTRINHFIKLKLIIRRSHMFEDAFSQLSRLIRNKTVASLFMRAPWAITMISPITGRPEEGIDAGGIVREFLENVLVRQCLNPDYGLFTYASLLNDEESARRDYIYPSFNAPDIIGEPVMDHYYFTGVLLGKLIQEGINLPSKARFSPLLMLLLLGRAGNGGIGELRMINPELYRSLAILRDMCSNSDPFHVRKDIEDLCLYYVVDDAQAGSSQKVLLVPNGDERLVQTPVQMWDYIALRSKHSCYGKDNYILDVVSKLRQGIFDVLPETTIPWTNLFSAVEFDQLIQGSAVDSIDINDLKQNVVLEGYNPDSTTIKLLWSVLEELEPEDQGRFLHFCTGSSRPPLLGFSSMNPPLTIRRANDENTNRFFACFSGIDRLPTASTCFNLIKLPPYRSKPNLREKLLTAIRSESGFNLS